MEQVALQPDGSTNADEAECIRLLRFWCGAALYTCLRPRAPRAAPRPSLAFERSPVEASAAVVQRLGAIAVHTMDRDGVSAPVLLVGTRKDKVRAPKQHRLVSERLEKLFGEPPPPRAPFLSKSSINTCISTSNSHPWVYYPW